MLKFGSNLSENIIVSVLYLDACMHGQKLRRNKDV